MKKVGVFGFLIFFIIDTLWITRATPVRVFREDAKVNIISRSYNYKVDGGRGYLDSFVKDDLTGFGPCLLLSPFTDWSDHVHCLDIS